MTRGIKKPATILAGFLRFYNEISIKLQVLLVSLLLEHHLQQVLLLLLLLELLLLHRLQVQLLCRR
jgi:hypothetical protein